MNAAGTSLLEVVFAMAIVVVIGTGLSNATQHCGRILASIRLHHQALSAARNILEGRIAAACASPVPCPENLRCVVSSAPSHGATRVSVRIDTAANPDDALAELSTVVAGASVCN